MDNNEYKSLRQVEEEIPGVLLAAWLENPWDDPRNESFAPLGSIIWDYDEEVRWTGVPSKADQRYIYVPKGEGLYHLYEPWSPYNLKWVIVEMEKLNELFPPED